MTAQFVSKIQHRDKASLTISGGAGDIDGSRGESVEAAVVLLVRDTGVRAGVLGNTLHDVVTVALRLLGGDVNTDVPGTGANLGADLCEKANATSKVGLASLSEDGDDGREGAEGVEVHVEELSVV